MRIQLIWTDLTTGESQRPILETPIALGREFALMPGVLEGNRVSRLVLAHEQVADYHALIEADAEGLNVTVPSGQSGVRVNGVMVTQSDLQDGDRIQIGPFDLQINLHPDQPPRASTSSESTSNSGECERMVGLLIPRRCGRTSPIGCPYCNNGNFETDPYFVERSYYSSYGQYGRGSWGSSYYRESVSYSSRDIDFTEADNVSFENQTDMDFEQDMGGS